MAITTSNSTSVKPVRACRDEQCDLGMLSSRAFQLLENNNRAESNPAMHCVFKGEPKGRPTEIQEIELGWRFHRSKTTTAMTASTQEGTYHPICGRSSDSLLFDRFSLLIREWTMAHETSEIRNGELQSSIQRPDRPGFSPEFPVHPFSQLRNGSPQAGAHFTQRLKGVNSKHKLGP